MRQAGLKPKSHSSGTYWIRANANTKGSRTILEEESSEMNTPLYIFYVIASLLVVVYVLAGSM
jgi:negative regulator of replication initiation